jgi:hypothetical protein
MKKEEDIMRNLFAQDRDNPMLNDPYMALLPVFDVIHTFTNDDTNGIPLLFDFEFPMSNGPSGNNITSKTFLKRENPQYVRSMSEFKDQFHVFTTGLFTGVDWSNMIAAGGSILASLYKITDIDSIVTFYQNCIFDNANPYGQLSIEGYDERYEQFIPEREDEENVFADKSDEEMSGIVRIEHISDYMFTQERFEEWSSSRHNKMMAHYMNGPWNGSDTDLFLYAINEEEAENKIRHLYDTFKKNLANPDNIGKYVCMFTDGTCRDCYQDQDILIVRTKASVTFHFRYPIRPIQVILRLYKSPAEVLVGFDVDCCCIGFDGTNVWALPRCRRALNQRMNLVDIDRQSTTYEIRLTKYAKRGFRVGVPGLDMRLVVNGRAELMYQRHMFHQNEQPKSMTGLAFLLQLEQRTKNFGMHRMFSHRVLWDQPNEAERQIYKYEKSLDEVYVQKIRDDVNFKPKRKKRHFISNTLKSKMSDYESFFINFTPKVTPKHVYGRMTYSVRIIRDTLKQESYRPDILFSLNDIEHIMHNNDESASVIVGKIEWLKINPGTQMVGSFNPVSKNFYVDAYTRTEEQEQEVQQALAKLKQWKEKRKMVKVTWSYEKNPGEWEIFDYDTNIALENKYRSVMGHRYYMYRRNQRLGSRISNLQFSRNKTAHIDGKVCALKREKEAIMRE